ncbi:major histocompatibility complex class I UBA precursor [Silurus asotus]|uniref:Major histocompatibility complex class I UBA n=1 Tax=Silurus asotus TaxID=30991 RepID=A0AAD5FIA1_SILAS|nr:major histocompatibility complex class I UBA precursor [Silurus asotus]
MIDEVTGNVTSVLWNTCVCHTLQRMYGCESDDDVINRRYDHYGFDGEDFISLNVENGTWTAVKPQAEILKHNWKSNGYITYWKNFLKHKCVDWLKTFVTVEKKVRPKTSLFQKEASSPEVVCHATGFFPKTLLISWQKNGQDVLEDVQLRETLPNEDGSFQKRSILKVSAEELQKHTYTCVIEHSSLEKDLVLPVSERRILRDGGLMGIIIGVVVTLLVLVAVVVAGILIWKKKNSGHKHVPVPARAFPHSLQYIYTAIIPTLNCTAVGLVNVYYDNSTKKMIPKTEWVKMIKSDEKKF